MATPGKPTSTSPSDGPDTAASELALWFSDSAELSDWEPADLGWTYNVAASAVEYLAAGETLVESFTITLDDGNGGLLVKRIDVTISGSNDAIIITGEDLVGAITEPVTPPSTTMFCPWMYAA